MNELGLVREVDTLTETERKLTYLARENARLRAEVTEIRRKMRPGRSERIVMRAREDAVLMLHLRHAKSPTSRRWLAEAGFMSQWRFGWALGLLRYARAEQMTVDNLQSLQAAIERVEQAAARLLSHPDALKMLRHFSGRQYHERDR